MYHAITGGVAGEDELSPGELRYAVSADVFRAALGLLHNVADPADWENRPAGTLLTFDDTLVHHYAEAAPILRERGLKAVFALTAAEVDAPGGLSWRHARELADQGHEIASHGTTHTAMGGLSPEKIRVELLDSKRIIEDRLGREVRLVTLPGGSARAAVFDIAREAGYAAVMTSRPGVNAWRDDLFEFRRFAVRRGYAPERVAALARGRVLAVTREKARYATLRAVKALAGSRRYERMHDS